MMSGWHIDPETGAWGRDAIHMGEKKITRMDAYALDRIAQLIAGAGAAEIDYKDARSEGVDALVAEAGMSGCLEAH